jgi:hypothetical protein
MTKFSPAAQAVLDAVCEICPAPADEIAAVALRVAANQLSRSKFIYTPQLLEIASQLETGKGLRTTYSNQ